MLYREERKTWITILNYSNLHKMDILKTAVIEAKYCFIYFMTILPFCCS